MATAMLTRMTCHLERETRCYGDWVDIDCNGGSKRTPSPAVTSFYYVRALGMLSEMAAVLGKTAESQQYVGKYIERDHDEEK